MFDKDNNTVLFPYDNRGLTPFRYYTAVPNNELQPITYLSLNNKILKRLSDIFRYGNLNLDRVRINKRI